MPKKGRRSIKGQPDIWDEVKKRVTIALTPAAIKGLDAKAKTLSLSRSELIEQFGRGVIEVAVQGETSNGQ